MQCTNCDSQWTISSVGIVLTHTSHRSSIDKNLMEKQLTLNFWKDWRLNKKRNWDTWFNHLPDLDGDLIIDAGCGDADVVSYISEDHEYVIGFDIILPSRKPSLYKFLMLASAEDMPFRDNISNCITSLQVAEHLPNPMKFIGESYRVLKTNGIVLFSTPTPKNKGAESESHFSVWDRIEWVNVFSKSSFKVKILSYKYPIGMYWNKVPLSIKLICGMIGGNLLGLLKMIIPELVTATNLKCIKKNP